MRRGTLPHPGIRTYKICLLAPIRAQVLDNFPSSPRLSLPFTPFISKRLFEPPRSFTMLLTSALSLGSLLTVASTAPIQARDGHLAPRAYKDVAQVLDRIVVTVTTIGSHVSAWPGNPRRANTLDQILGYIPIIKQDCANLVSDLQIGTDWIQKNKQTTLGVVDALYIVPKLATLNSAVNAYKDALIEKRVWADTSSITPDLYDQLLVQKQWATQLSNSITQSLSITTSWLGGPVGDFFFGSKLDEAIKAYSDGAKYRPGTAPGGQPPQQGPAPSFTQIGPQNWPSAQQGQNGPNQQQGQPQWQPQGQPPNQSQGQPTNQSQGQPPYPQQGQAPYPYQGQGGWNPDPPMTAPGVQEQPQEAAQPAFEPNPPLQDDTAFPPFVDGTVLAPSVSP